MSAPALRMTADEFESALKASGVSGEAARRERERRYPALAGMSTASIAGGSEFAPSNTVVLYPIRIVLPWSALCSDNERTRASAHTLASGKIIPRSVLTQEYQAARAKTREFAKEAMVVGGLLFPPIAAPLALVSRVFVPDERPHDVCNFAKCCHDALEKIVYANDRWLYDARWVRAGVDVDRPRAEIEVRPL